MTDSNPVVVQIMGAMRRLNESRSALRSEGYNVSNLDEAARSLSTALILLNRQEAKQVKHETSNTKTQGRI
jgi:hypothetical protein